MARQSPIRKWVIVPLLIAAVSDENVVMEVLVVPPAEGDEVVLSSFVSRKDGESSSSSSVSLDSLTSKE